MLLLKDLKVNNCISPIGLDDKFPEFSWNIGGDELQTCYQIIVSKDESFLAPVWDSGVIASNECLHIRYSGKELKSNTIYYWKVIINHVLSAVDNFETAFMNPQKEFVATWVGQPLGFAGCVDDVRLDFIVTKKVKMARFYVAMLGTGKVYLNGVLLDDCWFDGGIAVYSKHIGYRTYRLNPELGNNALCMRIGYGFYGAKKFYGLLRVEYEDGELFEMPTMSGRIWNIKKDEVIRNGVYDGETKDGRLKEDWLSREYKVEFKNWVASFIVDPPAGEMKAITIPPMRIVDTFSPLEVKRDGNKYLVDVGINICGFLSLKMKGERGSRIIITHAERLGHDGKLDNTNYRSAENRDEFILCGDGEESFRPDFTYHGFRFALLEVEGNIEILDVKACVLRSDIPVVSDFSCSDETFNRLHEIALRTEGNNFNGVFTDCPQRDERLGWLNDITSRLYQTMNNFALENFLPNFTRLTTESQNEDGIIPDTVPYEVGCSIADPVSAYIIEGALGYEYYGDKKIIEENYDGFTKWLEYLKSQADEGDGTVSYGYYGDWCPAAIYANGTKSKSVSDSFMSGIFFLWYLKHMEKFASLLGKREDERKYKELYSSYRKKFDCKYYDNEKGVYGNGSQAELAVSTTIFNEDRKKCARWMELAAKDVMEHGYHMTCGNQGYRHLIYNLAEYGYGETVRRLLTNKEYPGWGFMIESGATTIWERWENSYGDDMHSFDHPMFSAYDGFFINYLAGIRTDLSEDCFRKITIKPCFLSSVDHCRASLETLRGKITVEWRRNAEEILLDVMVPSGSMLKVVVDGAKIEYKDKKYNNEASAESGENSFIITGARIEK